MEHLLNDQVKALQISGIRKFFNMVSGKQDIVSLTIGQPDFPTPEHVKDAGKQAIDQNQTTYTHNAGLLPLRQAITDFAKDKYHLTYDPFNEVIVTVGASQAIDITLRTIIQTGDEVILPSPVYPGYEPLIRLAGGTPVHVDTRTNYFKLTKDLIEPHITSKTKCIILPYPSNPTGMTLNRQELQEIADLMADKDIFILADEIYSELVYEHTHVSLGTFPQIREKTIVINGVSKSHSMTGWRIGYLLCPGWLCQHILKVHQYNVSCATSISQHAALAALKDGGQDPVEMRRQYLKRRDYVYERLLKMGLNVMKPDGAFYFFFGIELNGISSFDLARRLVEEAKLALVPGDAFSEGGQGFLRLSYAYDLNTLEEGLNRLEEFLARHK
ncbi:aminotransferase A [Sediminibacillus dalangtanensis]|uniref:Aminotransferase n=1 Tax=Sediminibacillus dalangtanensis TaxID=2729421 RepID=A0ABX7VY43_9BACI|nr:aminotransferase A [Sediminibacillus dalangtanensis]QTM99252.1 aminotransferase A [Sediminibacillus dalangtanensis]